MHDFIALIPDKVTAIKFMEEQIWGNEPVCPPCEKKKGTLVQELSK